MGWNERGQCANHDKFYEYIKLLKRLLCGKAMNYMKYRTIPHAVTVRTMLTTRFIKVPYLFISLQV